MNIYDPSDRICYVHLSGPAGVRSASMDSSTACVALPAGYANQAPRTRLPQQAPHPRGKRAGIVLLLTA